MQKGLEIDMDSGGSNGGLTMEEKKKGRKRRQSKVGDEGSSRSVRMTPQLFVDNSLSVGGGVKGRGEVLKTQLEKSKCRQPNVNCRVEAFGRICSNFDEQRRTWVRKMGFEGLLELVDMFLPRNLCYWLFTRIDPVSRVFIFSSGERCSLTANLVGWVLGLPRGKKEVPKLIRGNLMKGRAREIQCKYVKDIEYKMKTGGKVIKSTCIPVTGDMISRLEGPWEESEKEEFKLLFLIVALDLVLCPTLNGKLGMDMIPAITCASRSNSFDWCSFVLQYLMRSAMSFSRQFYRKGYASGCAGCSIFLAIFYVDRLNRSPVCWGVWPRVKAWNMAELSKARLEDRLHGKGDYGNLGCVDVVYGEIHPNYRKDPVAPYPAGGSSDDDSCFSMCSEESVPVCGIRRKRGRKATEKVSIDREREIPMFGEEDDVVHRSGVVDEIMDRLHQQRDNMGFESIVSDNENGDDTFPKCMYRVGESSEDVGIAIDFRAGDEYGGVFGSGAVKPQVTRVFDEVFGDAAMVIPESVEEDNVVVESGSPVVDCKLIKDGECKSRKKQERHTNKYMWQKIRDILCKNHMQTKRKLLSFIMKEGALCKRDGSRQDPVLIRCGSMTVTVSSCYSVCSMRSGVDDQYVRTIAALFTCHWRKKFHGRSFRCMLDPTYAIRILKEGTLSSFRVSSLERFFKDGLQYQPPGKGCGVDRISEVFIPILQPLGVDHGLANHWWCLAVSLNSQTLYVIDSNTTNGVEEHWGEVQLILNALDCVFLRLDGGWTVGCMLKYQRKNLNMPLQPDVFSCGVFMLHAIYECAERFQTYFYLDDVRAAREWLVIHHVLLEENEALPEVKDLLCHC